MIKTFEEYCEKTMATCLPQSFNHDYMMYGLIGEVGEVAGKFAKVIRDGMGDLEKKSEAIMYELGDVAWMLAGLAKVHGLEQKSLLCLMDREIKYGIKLDDELSKMLNECSMLLANGEKVGEGRLSIGINCLWVSLSRIASALGYKMSEVCDANIAKLASRKERKVIKGNGDYR